MKIFYEDTMPYAAEHFKAWGDIESFNHKTVQPGDLIEADILFVRSTTKVNEELIGNCKELKFVATATSGANHVDIDYLKSQGIGFASAAGSNAISVAEYVVSAILVTAEKHKTAVQGKSVGVIGAGQVGTEVARKLKALGMRVFLCDPPLEDVGDERTFVSCDEALACDVVTLHTPLIQKGMHQTHHLINKKRLEKLRADQLLINAARGEVVDNVALLALFESGKEMQVVLDVWENEPDIDLRLLPFLSLATAHIAGHSIEGKAKGTAFVYHHAAKALGLNADVDWRLLLPRNNLEPVLCDAKNLTTLDIIKRSVLHVYDIRQDDTAFREQVNGAGDFQYYRKNYPIRREFASTQVKTGNSDGTKALYALGFLSDVGSDTQ